MMGSLCDGLMGFVIVSSVIVTTYGDVEDPTPTRMQARRR